MDARSDNEFQGLNKLNLPMRPGVAGENELASTSAQPLNRRRPSGPSRSAGVGRKQTGIDLHNEQTLAAVYDRIKPYEDFSYIRTGIIATEDKAILAQRVQSAIAWTGKQALEIEMEGKEGLGRHGRRSGGSGICRRCAEPIRGYKFAKSHRQNNALPGETIDFTIRFDNIGDQKIGNVTIVDSLTTRLEYVAGSEQSSMKATFIKPNEAGSVEMKWDLADPVPANGGGAVHFQCRVR